MKKLLLVVSLVHFGTVSFSQDPTLLNSNQSLVAFNPSYAGTNGLIRNQFLFRDQWPNLSSPYITLCNTFDAYIKPAKCGLAISYMHDDQARGFIKTDRINLTYAQHINLNDGKIKIIPSFQVGYFQKNLDRTKLYFGGIYYHQYVVPSQTKRNADFSAGLLFNYVHFYGGVSVFHITQPDEGLLGVSKLPTRLSAHASYNFHIAQKNIIQIVTRYEQQSNFHSLSLALNAVLFRSLVLGLGYRNQDAVSANVGYRNNYFSIQGGYDVTVSKLSGNTAGSFELSASFNLRNKDQRKELVDFERW